MKREPIATADNRRFYFSERLVSRGPDRVRQPIPIKKSGEEVSLIKKKKQIVAPGQSFQKRQ